MLIFDPDTTVESLETNLTFMEKYAHTPFNFYRVELYSGMPLLERMLNEGRCRGDYMGWDYTLHDDEIQKIFQLTMKAFQERNFSDDAIAYKNNEKVAVYRCGNWIGHMRDEQYGVCHGSAAPADAMC